LGLQGLGGGGVAGLVAGGGGAVLRIDQRCTMACIHCRSICPRPLFSLPDLSGLLFPKLFYSV
jgi:hypothetical protein